MFESLATTTTSTRDLERRGETDVPAKEDLEGHFYYPGMCDAEGGGGTDNADRRTGRGREVRGALSAGGEGRTGGRGKRGRAKEESGGGREDDGGGRRRGRLRGRDRRAAPILLLLPR